MVFSTNQVRQFYVVTKDVTKQNINAHASGATLQPAGATTLCEFDDWGQHQDPKTYEFLYVNALGELGHSDIIHRENIRKVSFTEASQLRTYLPTIKIVNNMTEWQSATDDDDLTKYKTGDVFYMNFSFPGFLNATDEEIETKTVTMRYNYNKVGQPMSSGDTNYGDWAAQMVDAITLAFNAKQNIDNDLLSASKSSTDVIVEMKPGKPWINGISDNKPNKVVIDNLTMENWHTANLISLPLENNSRVQTYGTATDITGASGTNYIPNGQLTADLEYFCMGERGDQYRMIGWPNYIPTKYLVDPSKEYDYLDVHYYFQGEGVRSDKSEKQITLVCETGSELLDEFYTTLSGKEAASEEQGTTGTEPANGTVGEGDTYTYTEADMTNSTNPKESGLYESDGDGGYVLTDDTTVDGEKTYYVRS